MKIEYDIPKDSFLAGILSYPMQDMLIKTCVRNCARNFHGVHHFLNLFEKCLESMFRHAFIGSNAYMRRYAFAFFDNGVLDLHMLADEEQYSKCYEIGKSFWIFEAEWNGKTIRQSLERVSGKKCREYVRRHFDEDGMQKDL